jgi:hypothetical protein
LSSKGNADVEENSRYLVSVSMLVLKGQGKVEAEENVMGHFEEDDASRTSMSQGGPPISPPRSPRSKARITAFTSECTQAAKRIRNFVGMNDDAYDVDGNECFSIDFNCLCPLLKRSNFGVPVSLDDSDFGGDFKSSYVNSEWVWVENVALVECDTEEMNPYVKALNFSIAPFLDSDSSFHHRQSNDKGLLFHLYRQHVSYLVGSALVSRLLSLTDQRTNEQKYQKRLMKH